MSFFQGNRNAFIIRDYPRGIILRRAARRHLCTINVAAVCGRWLAGELHLLSHRTAAVDTVGVKLYADRLRIEVVEIDLNLEYMLVPFGLDLQFAKEQGGPFLLNLMPPVDQLSALGPFISTVSKDLTPCWNGAD